MRRKTLAALTALVTATLLAACGNPTAPTHGGCGGSQDWTCMQRR